MTRKARNILPEKDFLEQCLKYDSHTGDLIWKERSADTFLKTTPMPTVKAWNTKYAGRVAMNSVDKNGYKMGSLNHNHYSAHRIIWKLIKGTEPYHVVHLNGNKLDNRIENLSEARIIRDDTSAVLKEANERFKRNVSTLEKVTGFLNIFKWNK